MSASSKPPETLDGPGTDTIAVGNDGYHCVLQFQHPVKWVKLDPKTTYQVAEMMCRHSFAVEMQDKVEGEWSSMVQLKRQQLLAKLKHAIKAAVLNGKVMTPLDIERLANQVRDHADDEYLGPRFSPGGAGGVKAQLIVSGR